MNRSTLARRYAPLVALAAIQLMIVALVPSVAPNAVASGPTLNAGGTFSANETGGITPNGSPGASIPGGVTIPGGGFTTGTGGYTTGPGGTVSSGPGSTSAPGVTVPPGVVPSGDTTHCVNGREFSASIAYYAPPCVPGTIGGALANNGGATYEGVNPSTITIVDYISNYGAEVNAILQAEGQLENINDAKIIDKAWENFINTHYVLYGRKVQIIPYPGTCTSVPPDVPCLLHEIDSVIDTYHPYIFYWETTLCSACYAEVARRHVVAVGGRGFSDAFANANAPYFYDGGESATRIESALAQWYCNQLSTKNDPSRVTRYAGTQNPAQNLNGKPRVLGVISTNDPDNEATVKNVLYSQLKADCGEVVTHNYFYDQNINTAAQQVQAGTAALDTPTNPATTAVCLCDPVAPQFLYEGQDQNNYYPENIIASDQDMDPDVTSQQYSPGNPLSCGRSVKCPYDNAFGLSTWGPQPPEAQNTGVLIAKAGGAQIATDSSGNVTVAGAPDLSPERLDYVGQDFVMMASLMENTGPDLTPANMQALAPRMPAVGGGSTGQPLLAFHPGDWYWTQDARVVYWDRNQHAPYNGKPGTFIGVEGSRFDLGQFPAVPGGPPIPVTRP